MTRNEKEWNTIKEVMNAYINGEISTAEYDELISKIVWK